MPSLMKNIKYFALSLLVFIVISCTKNTYIQEVVPESESEIVFSEKLIISGSISNEEAIAEISKRVGTETKEVVITNTTQLTALDISGISGLVYLNVYQNEKLTQVSLPNLEEVSAGITFADNIALETINMPLLKRAGYFSFNANNEIKKLEFNIETLTSGSLSVYGNPNLESVIFNKMASNSLSNYSQISISKNEKLKEVKLPLMKRVNTLFIHGNPLLTNLDLSSLSSLGDVFTIQDNTSLTKLSFPSLEEIKTGIYFPGQGSFDTLDFSKLKKVGGGVLIDYESDLVSLNFPVLESVEGYLRINNCSSLVDVNCPSLTSVESLSINENSSLVRVNAAALTAIDGALSISNNNTLTTLDLELLSNIQYSFSVENNLLLSEVNCPFLQVAGRVYIKNNDALKTINLSSLTSTSIVYIYNSNNSSSLDTFNLSSIIDFTSIKINFRLTQLDIDNLLLTLVSITPPIEGKIIDAKGAPSSIGNENVATLEEQNNNVFIRN